MRGKGYCDKCGHTVEANCPSCGRGLPVIGVTVDLIIEHDGRLWLVKRKAQPLQKTRLRSRPKAGENAADVAQAPRGWALPGGYVEYDETLEEAAMREGREELGAKQVTLLSQFHAYGDPARDPRRNVTVAYIAQVDGIAPDMAELQKEGIEEVKGFALENIPALVFDHGEIVADYLAFKRRLQPLKARRLRK